MSSDKTPIRDNVIEPAYPLTFPIFQTGSYAIPQGEKYRYGREANPTVEELCRQISILEETETTVCFSSGMGAITTTLMALLKPGDRVITTVDSFARSSRFIRDFLSNWGIKNIISEPGTENLLNQINEKATVFIETISNPSLRVYNIERIARRVHDFGGELICDATFSTPLNLRSHSLGADIVINSLSKFMSGHNDTIGGSASGSLELLTEVDKLRRTLGTNMDPNTAYLIIRGLKTLGLRMKEINKNGISVSRNLQTVKGVSNVNYPGLDSHPDFNYSRDVLIGYGGVITFDIENLKGRHNEFFKNLKIIQAANTLGGVHSVISHPKTMSHRSLSQEELKLVGIGDNTVRLSVGTEDAENILEDLKNAIDKLS